ncbi:fibrinogen-like protein A [Xenia sp. Carnegie-2017]|uniref:fibrinogen-like protein A n=1 Tax=Xenia sp. Carnegie-2017 TaxID=2897299 RepID=UPI001F047E43|nr:fibrinogen-like protein A [Xenia sp. Carnegie-2017]
MKRTAKPDQRNVTLKTQIASIKAHIATLQTYHKKLGAQNKHLQTFKLKLQSKMNKTKGQISKRITLRKQIKKLKVQMIKLSIQMKTLEAQLAKTQNMLRTLEKRLTTLSKEYTKLTVTEQNGTKISNKSKKTQGKNCADLYKKGEKKNGVYQINPDGQGYFKVFCDMKTSGGGWTVIQRRQDGSVNFYRGWNDYKQGFGDLKSEFWLGLDKIYRLTSARRNKLRVDLGDTSGNKRYAEYDYFAVENESKKYQLRLGKYSGTAGNSLSAHKNKSFTTKDSDNDTDVVGNCAVHAKGAWWYYNCYDSNLNGYYYHGNYQPSASWYKGVVWKDWKGYSYSLKFTEMKMKPSGNF